MSSQKYILIAITFFIAFACANDKDRSAQNIESRPIEAMSAREAQLLGLDLKQNEQDGWPAWTGPKVYSMEDAQRLAAENGKKVMVDIYAVWCGYCRKMAAETYPNQTVKEKIEEYFYVVRLNAESQNKIRFNDTDFTEEELAAAFGVSSFPSTVFIDTNGDPLGIQPGFMDSSIFSSLVAFVGSDAYKTQSYEQFVNSGN